MAYRKDAEGAEKVMSCMIQVELATTDFQPLTDFQFTLFIEKVFLWN